MAQSGICGILLLLAVIAANLPWLSDRFLIAIRLDKNAWWRWLEWLVWYVLTGLLAMAMENKVTGGLHTQQWEFYVATLCLFVVFALPGFIYHYDLKNLFKS
ncbi:MAG: DUF2818 family protein [Methylomonas sp.]